MQVATVMQQSFFMFIQVSHSPN